MLEKKKEKNLIFGILQNGNGICHNANRQREMRSPCSSTSKQKPPVFQHRGFSIPLEAGDLNLRRTVSYRFPSSHLQI